MYYFVNSSGQQQGPVSAGDLPRNGVTPQTLVWRQGMSGWQPAGTMLELSAIFVPPQIPPAGMSLIMPAKQQTRTYETGKDLGKGLFIVLVVVGVVLAGTIGRYYTSTKRLLNCIRTLNLGMLKRKPSWENVIITVTA